ETAWARWAAEGISPLAAGAWRFVGIRPVAAPPRRLAGVAHLLARTPADRLLADAARALRTLAPRPAARALAALLGPERAAEVVVSALLPLLAAWGEALGDEALTAAARACYLQHPPAGDNERLRHMRRQVLGGADRAATGTACRQQGLLHVYATTCGWRRCGACAVGPGPA